MTQMKPPNTPIHLFKPMFRVDECLEAIRPTLEQGWTGLGNVTVSIESAWVEYTGFPHALFLNSNTGGLHIAFKVLKETRGWADGDEVITTPITFVSTNHAILYNNLTPVFADIDDFLCIDPQSLLDRITERTRAVIFVGMGGNPGRYAEVVTICRERGIAIILDAAHMSGTKIADVHVGADADVAVFSFQAVKNLPTADSGMICFADSDCDEKARRLSWLGISKDTFARTVGGGAYKWMYEVDELGFKYNGNSVMAAMALVSLKYLDEDNAERRRMCALYADLLRGAPGISVVPMAAGCEPSRHLFQVEVEDRDNVLVALNERGIYPGVHYRANDQYGVYASMARDTPRARRASDSLLSLPLHLYLSDEDIAYVARCLREIVE